MPRHAERSSGTFEERCLAQAEKKLAEARLLPPGEQREEMIRDARQMRVAADLDKWLSSPGLKSPS